MRPSFTTEQQVPDRRQLPASKTKAILAGGRGSEAKALRACYTHLKNQLTTSELCLEPDIVHNRLVLLYLWANTLAGAKQYSRADPGVARLENGSRF